MAKRNDDVDAQIKDLLSAQRLAPDLETFAVACMNEWGGPAGLAAALKEDYDNCDSANTRSQILRLSWTRSSSQRQRPPRKSRTSLLILRCLQPPCGR